LDVDTVLAVDPFTNFKTLTFFAMFNSVPQCSDEESEGAREKKKAWTYQYERNM